MLRALRRYYSKDYTQLRQCMEEIEAIEISLKAEFVGFWNDSVRVNSETTEHVTERNDYWFELYVKLGTLVGEFNRLYNQLKWFEFYAYPEFSQFGARVTQSRMRAAVCTLVVKDRLKYLTRQSSL